MPVSLKPDLALREDDRAEGGTRLAPDLRDLALVFKRRGPGGHECQIAEVRERGQAGRGVSQRFLWE